MPKGHYSAAQRLFRDAVNNQHPDTYVDMLSRAIQERQVRPRDALLVLFQESSPSLWGTLIHKNQGAPGVSRDDRLLAWFEACATFEDTTAVVAQEVANQRDFRTSSKSMLRARAIKTIRWWQDRGIEAGLSLTKSPHRPTNMASLAVYVGQVEMAQVLSQTATLTHPELLWPRLWRKEHLSSADRLATVLLSQGPVPSTFMENLPQSAVNLKNAPSVLALAHRLVDEGHVVFPPQHATKCLASLVKHLRSPASLELVRFFLAKGADPIGVDPAAGPLSTALNTWQRLSLDSNLRAAHQECVELLVAATPAENVLSVLTPARVKALTAEFRRKTSRDPSNDAGPEIACLHKITLTHLAPAKTAPGSAPAVRM